MKFARDKSSAIRRLLAAAALTGVLAATMACAPVIETHGYFVQPDDLAALKEGSMSQREIEQMMGSPSTVAAFDKNTWYYIASISNAFAWKEPEVISRNVIAIKFNDETKIMEDLQIYTIKDGRIIAFADDITPTKGRELSVLEQLLGNVGRVSADQLEDQTGGGR